VGNRFLGLLSGTSVDGVDAAIVEFGEHECAVLYATTTPFPPALRLRIEALIERSVIALEELGALDTALGDFFGECALECMRRSGVEPGSITAIGHHGQTVLHQPQGAEPATIQLGDPNRVAVKTGLAVVTDFRRMDLALGGQGAPLMPAFHAWLLAKAPEPQAVVNIGGIANVTLVESGQPTRGFDTGPGNTLMDLWISRCLGHAFDADGAWGSGGRVDSVLLERLLADAYFSRLPPKSTGREYFHRAWLEARLAAHAHEVDDRDVQATLCELTARSIAQAIDASGRFHRVVLCGGGAFNRQLVARLTASLPDAEIVTSNSFGVAPDWVEAAGFAWFAWARMKGYASNCPSVTGARRAAVLGGVYLSADQ
jgi:anhydro-N-acetylmuramic acid kinase